MSKPVDHILELSYDPSHPGLEDNVERILWEHDSSGSLFQPTGQGIVVRKAFFDETGPRSLAARSLASLGSVEVRFEDREREDWLDHYEQSLTSIEVGRRFVVAPDPRLIGSTDRVALLIPQQRAFGTGSHETTALCLEMLETLAIRETRGLDVGTGSGILAIAMALLGGRRIVACDNDPEVLGVFGGNLERNHVAAGTVAHFVGTLDALRRDEKFDLITMNILPEVILPLLPEVAHRTSAGGSVIVSGVLISRRDEVDAAARQAGFTLARETARGEWWCGQFFF